MILNDRLLALHGITITLLIIKSAISSIVIALKNSYFSSNQNYNKILERDWLSAA